MGKADKRARATGRRGKAAPFVKLPNSLVDSVVYIGLSDKAKTLLVDVIRQYNGKNNGDLDITLKNLKKRGWTSNDTLTRAKQELLQAGLIIQTRQGGKHKCSLFAVAWQAVDECQGKIDVNPTVTPPLMLSRLEQASAPSGGSNKIKSPAPSGGAIAA